MYDNNQKEMTIVQGAGALPGVITRPPALLPTFSPPKAYMKAFPSIAGEISSDLYRTQKMNSDLI